MDTLKELDELFHKWVLASFERDSAYEQYQSQLTKKRVRGTWSATVRRFNTSVRNKAEAQAALEEFINDDRDAVVEALGSVPITPPAIFVVCEDCDCV